MSLRKISITQGRLVPLLKNKKFRNKIQQFPENLWKKELFLLNQNNIRFVEWVVSLENFNKNPITNINKFQIIFKLLKKNNVKIRSIDLDFFIYSGFFNKKNFVETKKKIEIIIQNSIKLKVKNIIFPFLEKTALNNHIKLKKAEHLLKYFIKRYNKKINFLIETDLNPKKLNSYIRKFKGKLGITYDTGNSAGLGYSLDDEIKYFNYVKNIHIKDKLFKGKSIRLGEGNYNFELFFSYYKKLNRKIDINLQTARAKNGKHVQEVLLNIEYLKNFLN